MSKFEVFTGSYFRVLSPNTGKYGPEKIPCLDTFHAVYWLPVIGNEEITGLVVCYFTGYS